MRILPYKMQSKSAKLLAQALDTKRVRHDGNFKNNYNHTVINWGSSRTPDFPVSNWLNNPTAVRKASDKIETFRALDGVVPIPRYTTTLENVSESLSGASSVVVRHQLRGHSGAGIELCDDIDNLPDAPLYVEYIKKQDEYRVHVFNGKVIDVQQKKKRRETPNEEVNYQIRNHSNGFIYARDNITPPDASLDIAVDAVGALGLDFGAVDIIYNAHRDQCYVLEVNTACGLEGSTLDFYVDAIREVI